MLDKRVKAGVAASLGVGIMLLSSGCGLQALSMSPSVGLPAEVSSAIGADREPAAAPSQSTAAPSSVPGPTPTPTAPTTSDLAGGALLHPLPVSDFLLEARYWSELPAQEWSAKRSKPLTISATASWGGASKVNAYVSALSYEVTDEDGNVIASGGENSSVSPGYQANAPFSYSYVLSIPPTASEVEVFHVDLRYDLLVQTTAKGSSYYKQSVGDTLTLTQQP